MLTSTLLKTGGEREAEYDGENKKQRSKDRYSQHRVLKSLVNYIYLPGMMYEKHCHRDDQIQLLANFHLQLHKTIFLRGVPRSHNKLKWMDMQTV